MCICVVRSQGGYWAGPGSGNASDLIALTNDLQGWDPPSPWASPGTAGTPPHPLPARRLFPGRGVSLSRRRLTATATRKSSFSMSAAKWLNALRRTFSRPKAKSLTPRRFPRGRCRGSLGPSCSRSWTRRSKRRFFESKILSRPTKSSFRPQHESYCQPTAFKTAWLLRPTESPGRSWKDFRKRSRPTSSATRKPFAGKPPGGQLGERHFDRSS